MLFRHRRAQELVVRKAYLVHELPELFCVPFAELRSGYAFLLGNLHVLQAVLVRTCGEEHALAVKPVPSGYCVCLYEFQRMPYVRRRVHVRYCRGYVEFLQRSHHIYYCPNVFKQSRSHGKSGSYMHHLAALSRSSQLMASSPVYDSNPSTSIEDNSKSSLLTSGTYPDVAA